MNSKDSPLYRVVQPVWVYNTHSGIDLEGTFVNQVHWRGSIPPTEIDLTTIAADVLLGKTPPLKIPIDHDIFPQGRLLVQERRHLRVARIAIPLGWRTQYEEVILDKFSPEPATV